MIKNREVIFGVVSERGSATGIVENRTDLSGEVNAASSVSGDISMSVLRLDPYPAAEREEF